MTQAEVCSAWHHVREFFFSLVVLLAPCLDWLNVDACLFLVSSGELNCYKLFSSGEEKLVKKYFQGEIFGELSLLYNSPRAATVVVSSDTVVLWKLDRGTFTHIVKESAIQKRKKYENFLKKARVIRA